MRQASDEGGDRWQFFHSEHERRAGRPPEAERGAGPRARRRPFFLEYQPVVAAGDRGRSSRVEALLRWRHPERGVRAAARLHPVRRGQRRPDPHRRLGPREAAAQGRAWHRELGRPLRMSVNISARQLHEETLVDTVRRTLRDHAGSTRTRSSWRSPRPRPCGTRATRPRSSGPFAAMGVRVALDDFGTGYSSLEPPRAPADLDGEARPLVRARPADGARACRGGRRRVIALGHRLGLDRRGGGRRDRRRARRPARRGLRRHPGLPLQRAARQQECTGCSALTGLPTRAAPRSQRHGQGHRSERRRRRSHGGWTSEVQVGRGR